MWSGNSLLYVSGRKKMREPAHKAKTPNRIIGKLAMYFP